MAITTEEQKAKAAKAAADKVSYLALAKWHDSEASRYREKADACEPLELVSHTSPGNFAGL